jgi:hypothetical protein
MRFSLEPRELSQVGELTHAERLLCACDEVLNTADTIVREVAVVGHCVKPWACTNPVLANDPESEGGHLSRLQTYKALVDHCQTEERRRSLPGYSHIAERRQTEE